MANRRNSLDDIFKRTEPGGRPAPQQTQQGGSSGSSVPAEGRTLSVGVGLKESEVAELDQIVDDLEITRNALMRYAIRYFLMQYNAGSINLAKDIESPESKKKLKMP